MIKVATPPGHDHLHRRGRPARRPAQLQGRRPVDQAGLAAGAGVAQHRGQAERTPRLVRRPPQAAVHRGVRLVLPRMGVRRAARPPGRAPAARPSACWRWRGRRPRRRTGGRRRRPPPARGSSRPSASASRARRGTTPAGPSAPVDARPPALDPLGQRVVGTLLRHQAVGDARVGAGRVLAVQQPAPRGPAQRAADQLGGARAAVVRAAGRAPPRRRAPRRRRSAWPGRRPPCRVAPPSPGRPARRRRRRRGRGCRRRRRGSCRPRAGRPAPPASRPISGTSASRSTPASSVPGATGTSSRPARRAGGAEHPLPDRRGGQVDGGHGGAPPEQRSERTHLRPGAEHGDGPALEPEPLRVRGDLADRVGRRRLEHARALPRRELGVQVGPDAARCPRYGSTSSVSGSLSPRHRQRARAPARRARPPASPADGRRRGARRRGDGVRRPGRRPRPAATPRASPDPASTSRRRCSR